MWRAGSRWKRIAACGLSALVFAGRVAAEPDSFFREVVGELTSIEPARNSEHPRSLALAAERIEVRLRAAGLTPKRQLVLSGDVPYENVSALIGSGSRPRIVVGAHYDACGEQPGADDNASGVAMLLDLARRLADATFALDVELVAYTLEEPPYFRTDDMGSAHHAKQLAAEGVDVRAMLSLEMLGYYRDEPGSQTFPLSLLRLFYPDRGNFVAVVGRFSDRRLASDVARAMRASGEIPVERLLAPASLEGLDFSDHLNYWAAGFRAVMLTDTAFFRNPHYHAASDRPETLDYARLAAASRAVAAAVTALAAKPD